MGRKIFGFFVVIFILFSLAQSDTLAQTSLSSVPLPGTNCGDSTDPTINKCCVNPIVTPAPFVKTGGIFGAIETFLTGKIESFTNPILEEQKQISIQPCINGVPSTPGDLNNSKCICIPAPTPTPTNSFNTVCRRMADSKERNNCNSCSESGGVWTSLGCFTGSVSEFIQNKVLGLGVGLAGGISTLCILFAAFQMQTSRGNAEKIKKAQELLTNCITGVMIVIFSVLILKIIGVDILRIPGFSQ